MQGKARKIVQAILYEAIAVACVAPALELAFGAGMAESAVLSMLMSAIAMSWNMAFNWAFERWEAQPQRSRTFLRRLLHALGFEGGLVLILLPLVAYWLGISLWAALVTNLALFVFFFLCMPLSSSGASTKCSMCLYRHRKSRKGVETRGPRAGHLCRMMELHLPVSKWHRSGLLCANPLASGLQCQCGLKSACVERC
jgi:uncharacterized membrane protein